MGPGSEKPQSFLMNPESGWEMIRAGVPLEGPTWKAAFVLLHRGACGSGEETGVGWGANTPSPMGQGVYLLAWCLLVRLNFDSAHVPSVTGLRKRMVPG